MGDEGEQEKETELYPVLVGRFSRSETVAVAAAALAQPLVLREKRE